MTIYEKLRLIRLEKGFSQENMANEMGIKTQSYSNIESGQTDMNWSRLLQIAGVFKMSIVEIILYGEKVDEMDFVKSKVEYHIKQEEAAVIDMQFWRNQAMSLTELSLKLQSEKERMQNDGCIKKIAYDSTTKQDTGLSVAAEPELKKKKH